jgi:hypothetical protein
VSPGTLGKDFVSVTHRRNGCFSLPSAREKLLGKDGFADALYVEPSLPICRVFLRFCRVLRALGKADDSGSDAISLDAVIDRGVYHLR